MSGLNHVEVKAQLILPSFCDEKTLKARFEKALGKSVSLIITDNSTSMLSAKRLRNSVTLRLHRMFLDADDSVVGEIIDFLRKGKRETRLIRRFIRQNSANLKVKVPKRGKIRTGGRFYDLMEIFNALNNEYFCGAVQSAITWGIRAQKRVVRKRTLGSYSNNNDMIRINPVLDKKAVPRYFIEFVVYHEMLHADLRDSMCQERRVVHSKEFRRRERQFKSYERAVIWEKTIGT